MKAAIKFAGLALGIFALGMAGGYWVIPQTPLAGRKNGITGGHGKASPEGRVLISAKVPPKTGLSQILSQPTTSALIVALAQFVAETPVPALPHLIEQAQTEADANVRTLLSDLVFSKWVVTDAPSALAFASAISRRVNQTDYLRSLFGAWAANDPSAAFAAAKNLDQQSFRMDAVKAVLSTWAYHDPVAALAAAKTLPPGWSNDGMQAVLESWSRFDPTMALGALSQITSIDTRTKLLRLILLSMAASDPAQAFMVLRGLSGGEQILGLYAGVFKIWGGQAPAKALENAQTLPAGERRGQAYENLFGGWATSDAEAAFRGALAMQPGADRIAALTGSFRVLTAQDPVAAVVRVNDLSDFEAYSRRTLLDGLVGPIGDVDPVSALPEIEKVADKSNRDQLMDGVLGKLSLTDPSTVVSYVANMPPTKTLQNLVPGTARVLLRDEAIPILVGQWAALDPAGALAWTDNNLRGDVHDTAVAHALVQMVATDPTSAESYLTRMPPSAATSGNDVGQIASSLGAIDPEMALNWVQSLSDLPESVRSDALASAVGSWVEVDPATAATYLQPHIGDPAWQSATDLLASEWAESDGNGAFAWANHFPAGTARDDVVGTVLAEMAKSDAAQAWAYAQALPVSDASDSLKATILSALAQADPAGAAQAAASLPAGSARTSALKDVAAVWMNQDPPAAAQWMLTLPPSPERDATVAQLVNAQATRDPEAAYNWALTINDGNTRLNAISTSLMQWARFDPQAAANVYDSAPITDPQARANLKMKMGSAPLGGRPPLRPSN